MITVFYCPECEKEIEESMECEDCEVQLESSEKCTGCGSYEIELVDSGDYPALRCEDCGWTTINMFEDAEGEDYKTAVKNYKEKMDQYKLIESRSLEDSYPISEITITDQLRIISPTDLKAEEVEKETYGLRRSTHKMEIDSGDFYYLHRDGLLDSGNYVTFPEDFDEEKRYEIIQEMFLIVLEEKVGEVESNFEPGNLKDLEVNTAEGFLFDQMNEEEKELYTYKYTKLLKQVISEFRDSDNIDEIKESVERYRKAKEEELTSML